MRECLLARVNDAAAGVRTGRGEIDVEKGGFVARCGQLSRYCTEIENDSIIAPI